ncbi:MAG: hypothetical protein N3A00_04475 [Thermodesulfovibrio sp.]|nr:hypothetical protein [Thermodesulfovibrio sp.]
MVYLVIFVIGLILFYFTPAFAEQKDEAKLEEIVVTATKTESPIEDLPVTVRSIGRENRNPQWRNIKAVKDGKVYKYPVQITGLFTPRVVLLIAWHASKFYPELKIDWVKIVDNFFKKFYGIKYDGPRN